MKAYKKIGAILIAFITLSGFTVISKIDGGGTWDRYIETAAKKELVVIDYVCISACNLLLASPKLQVSKYAEFGVHETRWVEFGKSYLTGKRSEKKTNEFKTKLPTCAVKLFESKHAFDKGQPTYFTGEEVLKACPQIQEFIEK
jgi:hypothetical protein